MERRPPDSPDSDRRKGNDSSSSNRYHPRSTDRGRERDRGERYRRKESDKDYGRERRRRSRSSSLDRERGKRQKRGMGSRRSKSRSRSPLRRERSRSRSQGREDEPMTVENFDELDLDEQEELMKKTMGFIGFQSTKGKHVDGGCNASGVGYTKPKKYRQYMNRRGGFNRMLDHIK